MIKDFYSFFPQALRQFTEWSNFISKVKEYYDLYLKRIRQLAWSRRIENNLLYKELAYNEGAYFLESDSDRQIRQAIVDSRIINRQPTRFDVWKPAIDRITLGDCQIVRLPIKAKPFIVGLSKVGTSTETIGGTATLDGDKIGTTFIVGTSTIGTSGETGSNYKTSVPWSPGYVCIDLNSTTPTNSQLLEIAKRLYCHKNSWLVIMFGYVSLGEFYPYSRLDFYDI